MRRILVILLVLCTICSCEKHKSECYQDLIDQKINEIINIISHSTGDSISDCRTYFITEGDACGPLFVFGIHNIDTALLMTKFIELGRIKQNYYNEMEKQGTPLGLCDLLYPDTLLIINGKCRACLKARMDDCKDTSVLFY